MRTSVCSFLVMAGIICLSTTYGLYVLGGSKEHLQDSSIYWDQYQQVFGARLNSVISNETTLNEIISSNVQLSALTEGSSQVGCSSYTDGHSIANTMRTTGTVQLATDTPNGIIFRPFVVNEQLDQMCFAIFVPASVSLPNEVTNLFTFSFPVPPVMKIERSIYDYINDPLSHPLLSKLTVSYLMNSTSDANDINFGNANAVFQASQLLTTYPTQLFEDFFWTSTSTETYFTKSLSDKIDADRSKAAEWKLLASILSPTDINLDPCGVKSMKVDKYVDRLVLSLDIIKTLSQPLQSSCIVLISTVMAQQKETWHISLSEVPQLMNFRARSITQSSTVGSDLYFSPYTKAGLKGDGQIASVADTGCDRQSCYFIDTKKANAVQSSSLFTPVTNLNARKIVQYSYYPGAGDTTDEVDGHGTHVSGTIIGNRLNADISSDGMYDGVAPNGKLAFMDLATPGTGLAIPPVANLYGAGHSAGSKVHTNSWGTMHTAANYYVGADTDQFLYDNMDFTILFAAGNFGGDGPNSVCLEAQAKNVVSVGSSETTWYSNNINYISFFSSHGPSFDGRIKPEIVAPGDNIQSAKSNGGAGQSCSTVSKMGTSMASPSAAGVVLLIRQYLLGVNNRLYTSMCNAKYSFCKTFSPSGVLVKALLLHSGTTMTMFNGQEGGNQDIPLGAPPDNTQGYGRLNLMNILPLSGYTKFDLYLDDLRKISEMSVITYQVVVTDTSVPLKVTLSWYDPPSVYGTSGSVLLNNLDLLITSPSGVSYYGNGLSSPDIVNNNEQIFVANPTLGTYKVSVSCKSLPGGAFSSQLYSLVITSGGSVIG